MSMVKMINALTGTEMFVPEERLEEYLSAGHRPAERPVPETREAPNPKTAEPAAKRKAPAKSRTKA